MLLITRCANPPVLLKFSLDPAIGDRQTLLEGNRGLPFKLIAKTGIVAVPAAHALRFADVVTLPQGLSGDPADDVHELVDGD